MEQTHMDETAEPFAARGARSAGPDTHGLEAEAASYVAHPHFDAAMRDFCRGLAEFHSIARARRTGVVDTITWAVSVLVLYLDAYAPQSANASRIVKICSDGRLSGATAVRNAIARLRQGGMIAVDSAVGDGRAHRLRPTRALVETMQDNLATRFAAIEPVIAWPEPAREWARAEGVLLAFVRGNVEAYRDHNFTLYENFPEIRGFMDRHCGYVVLLHALARLETTNDGAAATLSLSEMASSNAVSRAHVRKLFAAATARAHLRFESGGRLHVPTSALARYRLWIGHEFAWTRRLVAAP